MSAQSVFRIILAPCVDFRPAPGCRPPGPRRDTPSVGVGVVGFSAPPALTIPTSTPGRRCPKGVQSGIRAYKCANLRAEGGRFELPRAFDPGGFQDRCLKPGSATPPWGRRTLHGRPLQLKTNPGREAQHFTGRCAPGAGAAEWRAPASDQGQSPRWLFSASIFFSSSAFSASRLKVAPFCMGGNSRKV